jgi:hypothetical protein
MRNIYRIIFYARRILTHQIAPPEESPAADPIRRRTIQLSAGCTSRDRGPSLRRRRSEMVRRQNHHHPAAFQWPIGAFRFLRKDDSVNSLPSSTSPNVWSTSRVSPETLDRRRATEPTLPNTVNSRCAHRIAARSLMQRTGVPATTSSSIATNGNAANLGNWLVIHVPLL